jgi:hypothetical protein
MVQPPKITFLTNHIRDHYADCYNSSIICNSNEKFYLIYFRASAKKMSYQDQNYHKSNNDIIDYYCQHKSNKKSGYFYLFTYRSVVSNETSAYIIQVNKIIM